MRTVALIGLGGMGLMHYCCYLEMKDKVKIVAIAEGNTEKAAPFAEKVGAKLYADAEELLKEEKPDIIDICLPTFLHARFAAKAMENGAAVFIEKPVALTAEEAEMLLDVQKKTGAKVQVGQVVRFMQTYRYLKNLVKEKTYGRVISGTFRRLSFRPRWAGGNLCDYRKSGTVALDMHIHDIDYIRYLMEGDPDKIEAAAVRDKEGVIQQIFATYSYGDAVITAEGGWDFPDCFPFEAGYRVKLEGATIVFDGEVRVYPEEGTMFIPELPPEFQGKADVGINISDIGAYYEELKYFVNEIVDGNGEEIAPLFEAIKSAQIAWRQIDMVGGMKA